MLAFVVSLLTDHRIVVIFFYYENMIKVIILKRVPCGSGTCGNRGTAQGAGGAHRQGAPPRGGGRLLGPTVQSPDWGRSVLRRGPQDPCIPPPPHLQVAELVLWGVPESLQLPPILGGWLPSFPGMWTGSHDRGGGGQQRRTSGPLGPLILGEAVAMGRTQGPCWKGQV